MTIQIGGMAAELGLLRDIAERVRRIEARLERLLASGWRHAGTEAAELAEEAAALGEVGLSELSERLRHVAAAESGTAALRAIALALAACRQLRARLVFDEALSSEWWSLASRRRAAPTLDRLIPVGRMAVGTEALWACVRLRGGWPDSWYLVEPPNLHESLGDAGGSGGAVSIDDYSRTGESGAGEPAWLRCIVEGRLRWRARYPLGATGDVERCRLAEANTVAPHENEARALSTMLELIQGKGLRDGATVLSGTGSLRLRLLEPAESNAYLWPDPAACDAFRSIGEKKVWALTWVEGSVIKPLVLLSPAGFLRKPHLIHLVPGCPRTVLVL
ncbi:MAG: hypothetical protein HY332_14550 [Chloroflexi bacterium]|nr:hypothetical protein [Chloroflexota bacterium]